MKSSRFNLIRPVRFLLALCACAFLVLSQAMPAYSATSSPRQGEENLTKIERESQKVVQQGQPTPGEKQTKAKTSGGGLNAIQGTADVNKMKRPENTKGEGTVEKAIGETLEKAAE